MTPAAQDLYYFVHSAVKGICDKQEKVIVEVIEMLPKNITLVIKCCPTDYKYFYSKQKEIKLISTGIAKRHKKIVNLILDE